MKYHNKGRILLAIMLGIPFFSGCSLKPKKDIDPIAIKDTELGRDMRSASSISLVEFDIKGDVKRAIFGSDGDEIPILDELNFDERIGDYFTYRDIGIDLFWIRRGGVAYICPHPFPRSWCHIFCRQLSEVSGNIIVEFVNSPLTADGVAVIKFPDGEKVELKNYGRTIEYSEGMSAFNFDLRDEYGKGVVGYTGFGKIFEFRDTGSNEIIERGILQESIPPFIE